MVMSFRLPGRLAARRARLRTLLDVPFELVRRKAAVAAAVAVAAAAADRLLRARREAVRELAAAVDDVLRLRGDVRRRLADAARGVLHLRQHVLLEEARAFFREIAGGRAGGG